MRARPARSRAESSGALEQVRATNQRIGRHDRPTDAPACPCEARRCDRKIDVLAWRAATLAAAPYVPGQVLGGLGVSPGLDVAAVIAATGKPRLVTSSVALHGAESRVVAGPKGRRTAGRPKPPAKLVERDPKARAHARVAVRLAVVGRCGHYPRLAERKRPVGNRGHVKSDLLARWWQHTPTASSRLTMRRQRFCPTT